MADPIPATSYGQATWEDWTDNWRKKDGDFLQLRSILRYADEATRPATAQFGQAVYVEATDAINVYSKAGKWISILASENLKIASTGTGAGGTATLSHPSAGGSGLIFSNNKVRSSLDFETSAGLQADSVSVKTASGGSNILARLTTTPTHLVSDSPVSVPAITLTGTGGVLSAPGKAITVGTLNADSATIPNITMTGTLSGGVSSIINGGSGTIGGVKLGLAGSGYLQADNGFYAQAAAVHGDASNAFFRQRAPNFGAWSSAYLQATTNEFYFQGATNVWISGYLRIREGKGIPWHNAAGTHQAWISPVIYSGGDPGAANFPDGTLWIS